MTAPIVFLDIDGVLCTRRAYAAGGARGAMSKYLDPVAVGLLNRLCDLGAAVELPIPLDHGEGVDLLGRIEQRPVRRHHRVGEPFPSFDGPDRQRAVGPEIRVSSPLPDEEHRRRVGETAEAERPFVSVPALKSRGWTPLLITRFLGEPDKLAPNPHYRSAAPMRLYARERVEAAEASPEYKAALPAARQRSAAGHQGRRDQSRATRGRS